MGGQAGRQRADRAGDLCPAAEPARDRARRRRAADQDDRRPRPRRARAYARSAASTCSCSSRCARTGSRIASASPRSGSITTPDGVAGRGVCAGGPPARRERGDRRAVDARARPSCRAGARRTIAKDAGGLAARQRGRSASGAGASPSISAASPASSCGPMRRGFSTTRTGSPRLPRRRRWSRHLARARAACRCLCLFRQLARSARFVGRLADALCRLGVRPARRARVRA